MELSPRRKDILLALAIATFLFVAFTYGYSVGKEYAIHSSQANKIMD